MTPEARVTKLEALLGRVQKNRREAPSAPKAAAVAKAPEPKKPSVHPPLPTHAVVQPQPAPKPEAPKIAEVVKPFEAPAISEMEAPVDEARVRAPRPTPMEQAVVELAVERPDPSVDVEITVDDDGTELIVEAGYDEATESFEDTSPTAPVELRSPEPERQPTPAPAQEAALEPRIVPLTPPAASAPIARVVSRAAASEPATFGELLDRTLALRPR